MSAQLGLDGLAPPVRCARPSECNEVGGVCRFDDCHFSATARAARGEDGWWNAPPAPPAPPRAIEEFLSGYASHFAYGPNPSAAQRRQAAQVGRELAERLAAFRAAGAA